MTRLLGFLVNNWPLKVAAVVLASLLYSVLVLARDAQQIPVTIPIKERGVAENAVLLSPLGQVTRVRYFAPPDVEVNSDSFIAWVDLAGSPLGDEARTVNVQVDPVDPRVRPLEWEPRVIRVTVDEIVSKRVPVIVDQGEVPAELDVRRPELEPETAMVRGAASVVSRVDRVVASVTISSAALDIDRDVQLVPVDAVGVALQEVDVAPSTARVRIAVIKDGETRTLPVSPNIVGQPAPGFELEPGGILVEPLAVTVEGDGDQLADLTEVGTEPISLNGASSTLDRPAALVLPTGVLPVDATEVRVVVAIRPVTGTRTLTAGIRLEGALPDRPYEVAVQDVLVTLGGSVADLARFQPASFELEVPVAGLPPGRYEIEITADLPAGLTLVSASPRTVIVSIGAPPSVAPSATPSVAPSAAPTP